MTMSLPARLLSPPLLEVLGLAMLIHCGKPPDAVYQWPEFLPQVIERGRLGR
jgi:hypothetical protein